MVALYFIYFMVAIAILADFIANDKPIVCSYKGKFYAPVVQDYLVGLGISSYPPELSNADWKAIEYDWKVFPPIPYSGNGLDITSSFTPPFEEGSNHYLGTDQVGHDLLAGIIHGSRIALSVGFVSMGIATLIGVILGSLAGYFGGWVDIAISRLIELFLNFPVLFLILAVVAFLDANIFYTMIIIGLTGWMGIARLVRGEVLRVRSMEYITAAKSLGFGSARVIFRHVLPNSLAPVLVSIAFGIAGAILTESALSYLGFGVPQEVVTWGSALNQSRSAIFAWWQAVFPGLMIFLTVLSYNMIGDGLRDATDPRLKI
jgi:peptide/nickel transport system permease protein